MMGGSGDHPVSGLLFGAKILLNKKIFSYSAGGRPLLNKKIFSYSVGLWPRRPGRPGGRGRCWEALEITR